MRKSHLSNMTYEELLHYIQPIEPQQDSYTRFKNEVVPEFSDTFYITEVDNKGFHLYVGKDILLYYPLKQKLFNTNGNWCHIITLDDISALLRNYL